MYFWNLEFEIIYRHFSYYSIWWYDILHINSHQTLTSWQFYFPNSRSLSLSNSTLSVCLFYDGSLNAFSSTSITFYGSLHARLYLSLALRQFAYLNPLKMYLSLNINNSFIFNNWFCWICANILKIIAFNWFAKAYIF